MSGGGRFLSRWSRLKREAEQAQAPVAPPAGAPQETPPARPDDGGATMDPRQAEPRGAEPQAVSLELPPLESLGIDADISGYLKKEVGESLRRAALRKLFSDPHFNRMDGLDVYVDDYSVSAPIPPDVMKRLRQFQTFLSEEKTEDEGAPQVAEAAAEGGAGEPAESPGVPDAGEGADAPQQSLSAAAEAATSKNCDTLAREGQEVAGQPEEGPVPRKIMDSSG